MINYQSDDKLETKEVLTRYFQTFQSFVDNDLLKKGFNQQRD